VNPIAYAIIAVNHRALSWLAAIIQALTVTLHRNDPAPGA